MFISSLITQAQLSLVGKMCKLTASPSDLLIWLLNGSQNEPAFIL